MSAFHATLPHPLIDSPSWVALHYFVLCLLEISRPFGILHSATGRLFILLISK